MPTDPPIPTTPPVSGTPSLNPQRLDDMLDYRLYLTYRDCGYVTENLLQLEFGINRRRWRMLATVHEQEGASLQELARQAELDTVQTSRTVGTMVREGLLRRHARPGNARFAHIICTDKGRALHDAIMTRYREANRSLVAALTPEEACVLDQLLEKIRGSLPVNNAND